MPHGYGGSHWEVASPDLGSDYRWANPLGLSEVRKSSTLVEGNNESWVVQGGGVASMRLHIELFPCFFWSFTSPGQNERDRAHTKIRNFTLRWEEPSPLTGLRCN